MDQSSAPAERNNNIHFSPLEIVETEAAPTTGALTKAWIMLTPKVLKIIIIVLASAVVTGICSIIIIIVINVTAMGGPATTTTPSVSSTTSPPTPTVSTAHPTPTITVNITSSSSTSTSPSTTSSASSTTSSTSSSSSTTSSSTTSSTSSTTSSSTSSTTTSPTSSSTTTTTMSTTTTVQVCSANEFPCGSGECIAFRLLCNGFPNCKDGSDEGADCACGADQWKCASGQCVSDADRCNQVYDCLDFSDEALCPDCSGFQCDSGICLWDGSQGRCNGVFDCSDLSDEMGCPPRAGTVACANTVRVLQSQWCNGLDNCGDNSDEINCGRSCSVGRVACPDSRCILRTWLCDGYPDCTDGSDEEGCGTCEPTQLACDNHQCIEEGAVCDGQPDCRAGEDESACFSTEETDTGVLWVRYRGKDYAVCSDVWSPALGEQVCGDINHQFLSVSEAVKPAAHIASFAAFSSVALDAKTSNIVIKDSCDTGHVVSVSCQKQECGQRQVPFVQSFVAGGEIVPPGKWPWVVSLLYLGQAICGGTLIDKKWVVTAAHCILSATKGDYDFTATPYYFDVIVGSTHRMGRSSVGTPFRVRVDKIFLYPERKVSLYGTVDWDIALLRLSVPVEITNYIQPLCLPHFGQHIPLTSLCYLAGWGQTSPQQVVPLDHLRDTRMQLWSETRCSRNTVPGETTVNTNSTICGGFIFGRPSGCQGDSGGPLMCWSASGRWMLAGVMSRGSSPCGLYQPGLRANRFARVASVVDWIQQQIGDQ